MLTLIAYLALFVAAANCQNNSYICGNDNHNITCEEKPCNPRLYGGADSSAVCVCNETYCDNYVHTFPTTKYECIQTTSSKAGDRYKKTNCTVTDGDFNDATIQAIFSTIGNATLAKVNTLQRCAELIEGFGTALTDAAGYLLSSLSEPVRLSLLKSYFGPCGNDYIFCRIPVGGSDFSTHNYTYNDNFTGDCSPDKVNSTSLFDLNMEDYTYKIPHLNTVIDIMNSTNDLGDCCRKLKIIAACWTPPLLMKTKNVTSGRSFLRPECYRLYILNLIRYIQLYQQNLRGYLLYAISIMNEPSNGRVGATDIPCCGVTPAQAEVLLVNHICPLLSKIIKIMILDDQTILGPELLRQLSAAALSCVSYIAKHWYIDFITGPVIVGETLDKLNSFKNLISTEACTGANPGDQATIFGSWARAERYASSILTDLKHCVRAWIDWNMCLDLTGGFTYINNEVDSPIIVNVTANEFFKNPMYYAMGHFSMFVPPCSVRIEIKLYNLLNIIIPTIDAVAFLTPKGIIVIVVVNQGISSVTVLAVVNDSRIVTIVAPARSFATVQIKNSS